MSETFNLFCFDVRGSCFEADEQAKCFKNKPLYTSVQVLMYQKFIDFIVDPVWEIIQ